MDEQADQALAEHPQQADPAPATPPPQPTGQRPVDPRQLVDGYLIPIVTTMIRGAFTSIPNAPKEQILLSFCRVLGMAVGGMIVGEAPAVMGLRAACRRALREGMDAVPIQPPPKAPPRQDTAVKPAA